MLFLVLFSLCKNVSHRIIDCELVNEGKFSNLIEDNYFITHDMFMKLCWLNRFV